MSLIQVDNLHLTLGNRHILQDVGFSLDEGSILLVIGPNGAGKSSLLQCVLGLHRDFGGSVSIDGTPLKQMSGHQRARLIGYVPQILEMQFNMDVASFMALSRYAHDYEPASVRDQIIRESLEQTETSHLVGSFMDQLSGGERQRVLIASALAQQPKVLILDEPDQSLDPAHRVELARLLERLHKNESLTILMVTHDWNQLSHLNPGILALDDGRVAVRCDADQLDTHLEDLFGCRFHQFNVGGRNLSIPRFG